MKFYVKLVLLVFADGLALVDGSHEPPNQFDFAHPDAPCLHHNRLADALEGARLVWHMPRFDGWTGAGNQVDRQQSARNTRLLGGLSSRSGLAGLAQVATALREDVFITVK